MYLPIETRIINAIKALGLTAPVYRGTGVPEGVTAPYILVHPGPMSPPVGNRRRDDADVWAVQRLYVEIYQRETDNRGKYTADASLPVRVFVALDHLVIPGTLTPLVVEGSTLVPDPDPAIRHDSITVRTEVSLTDDLAA